MDCKKPPELSKMTFLEIDLRRCLNKIFGGGGAFFELGLDISAVEIQPFVAVEDARIANVGSRGL